MKYDEKEFLAGTMDCREGKLRLPVDNDSDCILSLSILSMKKDNRPICNCSSYTFPHRIGGKCDGSEFTKFYLSSDGKLCSECNCYRYPAKCDVASGLESISYAECYLEFKHYNPSEHLPLNFIEPEYPEEYCDINSHLDIDFQG